jgi:hypothetical protein
VSQKNQKPGILEYTRQKLMSEICGHPDRPDRQIAKACDVHQRTVRLHRCRLAAKYLRDHPTAADEEVVTKFFHRLKPGYRGYDAKAARDLDENNLVDVSDARKLAAQGEMPKTPPTRKEQQNARKEREARTDLTTNAADGRCRPAEQLADEPSRTDNSQQAPREDARTESADTPEPPRGVAVNDLPTPDGPSPDTGVAPFQIRIREVKRKRRAAAQRGPEAKAFRRRVRKAYRMTCVVCGLHLPALRDGGRPGVDAAHILPDSEFDLNEVRNGLCLCKNHHWAFDEGIIEIRPEPSGGYAVAIPEEARAAAQDAGRPLGFLEGVVGPIPQARLPENRAAWPQPECLSRLREILHPQD